MTTENKETLAPGQLIPGGTIKVPMTVDAAKSVLQLALIKVEKSVQALNDIEATLIYNEDHLVTIKQFIDNCKEAGSIVEKERVRIKNPAKVEGDNIDAGSKLIKGEIEILQAKAQTKYTELNLAILKKKEDQAKEEKRVKDIQDGMAANVTNFSVKIADCKTNEQLLAVERLINLEKGRKEKYQEFLPEMVEKLNTLTPLLTSQKENIKELDKLNVAEAQAIQSGDAEAAAVIAEKKEEIDYKVQETKVNVTETAIRTTNVQSAYPSVSVVLPDVKVSRRQWKAELVKGEEAKALKAGLLDVELNPRTWRSVLETLKETGVLKDKKEYTLNGVRYFEEVRF